MDVSVVRAALTEAAPGPSAVKRVLWITASSEPLTSGELRRLGVPALLVEADGWTSQLIPAALAGTAAPADVAVISLEALDCLPLITRKAASIIVEIGERSFEFEAPAPEPLAGLVNRIAGVVVHGRRGAAWARRAIGGGVPIWSLPDAAVRAVELSAAALRFDVAEPEPVPIALPEHFELWFLEPGDSVDDEEIRNLVAGWAPQDAERVVVAPRRMRIWLRQLGLDFIGLEWSPSTLQQALMHARRCKFSDAASPGRARRRVTALRYGARTQNIRADVVLNHDPVDVARRWRDILDAVPGNPEDRPQGEILVFLDLVQDLDLALPIIDEVKARCHDLRVVVSDWLDRRSPRVAIELSRRGVASEVVPREAILDGRLAEGFAAVAAVLSPAESSLPAHRRAHVLFRQARARGIPTFSLQHGLENVGLSSLEEDADGALRLFSDHLFVWAGPGSHSTAVPALRPRLVHIGRLASPVQDTTSLRQALGRFAKVISVFENLHWGRYDEAWRSRFLGDCVQFARERPETAVILKPHHGGLWSVKNAHQFPDWPNNLILADPTDPSWEPFTAPALLQLSDMVITTPSTVALDAAQANRPVAVAAYGLALPTYAPLPLLQSLADWDAFAADGSDAPGSRRARARFIDNATVSDNAAHDVVTYLEQVMIERARVRRAAEGKP